MLLVIIVFYLLMLVWEWKANRATIEQLTIDLLSIPVDPECANGTPMDLVRLYKGNNDLLGQNLRASGIPASIISDHTKYPLIMTVLKRMGFLQTCAAPAPAA